jgi:hypothetical protein
VNNGLKWFSRILGLVLYCKCIAYSNIPVTKVVTLVYKRGPLRINIEALCFSGLYIFFSPSPVAHSLTQLTLILSLSDSHSFPLTHSPSLPHSRLPRSFSLPPPPTSRVIQQFTYSIISIIISYLDDHKKVKN